MAFRFIPLNYEPSLAVWVPAVGEFPVPVWGEGGEVVAEALSIIALRPNPS